MLSPSLFAAPVCLVVSCAEALALHDSVAGGEVLLGECLFVM